MKKAITLALCILLLTLSLSACNRASAELRTDSDGNTIVRIGATPTPHAEILEFIAPFLLEEGIRLEVHVFTDFAFPNPALSDGSLDANYFQHVPFLENYMDASGNELYVMGAVHIEPMGAYSMTINNINELPVGAIVAFPDCPVNGPRALILMADNGLLTLSPYAGYHARIHDIIDNPLELQFVQLAAALLPRVLLDQDADMSIINTNHVLSGAPEVDPERDALIRETTDTPYANMLVVRPEHAEHPVMLAIMRHLQTEQVREFILENYSGIVPVF